MKPRREWPGGPDLNSSSLTSDFANGALVSQKKRKRQTNSLHSHENIDVNH